MTIADVKSERYKNARTKTQEQVWFDSLRASQADREHNKKSAGGRFQSTKIVYVWPVSQPSRRVRLHSIILEYGLIFEHKILLQNRISFNVQLGVYFVITYKRSLMCIAKGHAMNNVLS